MELRKKIVSGISWSLLDKFLSQFLYLLVVLYIARKVGPELFGVISILTVFMVFTESIVNNGISQSLIQRSVKITDGELSTFFYVCGTWGLGIYFSLICSLPLISTYFGQNLIADYGELIFISIITNSLSVVPRVILTIKMDFKNLSISSLYSTFLASAAGIYLINAGYGALSLVYLMLIKSASLMIFIWFFSRWFPKKKFSYSAFKGRLYFSSNVMASHLLSAISNGFSTLFIGKIFSIKETGFFSQANVLTSYIYQLIASTSQGVTYPAMTSLVRNQDTNLRKFYRKAIAITIFFSLPVFVGFSTVSSHFVNLFMGDKWCGIVPFIIAFSLAKCLSPIAELTNNMLYATERTNISLKIEFLKSLFVVLAMLIFMDKGVYFIVLIITCSSFLSLVLYLYYSELYFGFGFIQVFYTIKNYIFASFLMSIVLFSLDFGSELTNLIMKVILGLFIYITILIVLNDNIAIFLKVKVKKLIINKRK